MAEHTLAILVKAIGSAKAAKDLKGVDAVVSNIGAHAGKGLRTAASNLAFLGKAAAAAGGVALVAGVKGGVESLATLENATTQVSAALKRMGQSGTLTASQVAGWANEIEANIGAAFDDKDITAATATLIRFGSVTPKNLHKAMVVMTDLAAKTGSVESASTLLAKALADPTKAAGKLARSGIVLTKVEQDKIKALVKAGKVEQAQGYILDKLAAKTKGAAAATQGPYARSLSTLKDTVEDAERALAVGFLPVIQRAADWLKTKLADPNTITWLRKLGDGLGTAAGKALDFIDKIDWGAIGSGLKTAGEWAGKLVDAFMSLPPDVKTTLIAMAGLNKLSGGAIGDIVSELGKGLIKGVLGINAAVVNVNGGVVNGGAGAAPAAAAAGGAAAGTGLAIATSIVAPVAVAAAGLMIQDGLNKQADALNTQAAEFAKAASDAELRGSIEGLRKQVDSMVFNSFDSKNKVIEPLNILIAELNRRTLAAEGAKDPTGFLHSPAAQKLAQYTSDTVTETNATKRAVQGQTLAERINAAAQISGAAGNAARIVSAIFSARPVVTQTVTVNVTGASVTSTVTKTTRTGSSSGSAGGGRGHAPIPG